jgi:hypothetical protein
MTGKWLKRLAVLAVCVSFSCYWALLSRGNAPRATTEVDFVQMYFGVRCALDGKDIYDGSAPLRAFDASGWRFPTSAPAGQEDMVRTFIALADYPPSTYFVLIPLAWMPFGTAQAVWFWMMTGLLVLAALLMWDLAADAPALAGCMAGFVLLNSKIVLMLGNPAGIVVPLCVIAAWCLVRQRYAPAAVVMLAVCLMMKPQDAGFVWLYFLLAGGKGRKRAWQALLAVGVLGICAAVWIGHSSPNWVQEMHGNIAEISARGWFTDAGRGAEENFRSFDPTIGLPGVFSVFGGGPAIYDALSFLVGGGLIAVWCFEVLRKCYTREGALYALAAVSALTLIVVYHRTHDTKLLLLTVPACAMLWARGGAKRWVALALTTAAILVTSDLPIIFRIVSTENKAVSTATFAGRLMLLALQPAPLVLLAAGCFYLWVYIRYRPEDAAERDEAVGSAAAAAVS